jgi:hypothetical protein
MIRRFLDLCVSIRGYKVRCRDVSAVGVVQDMRAFASCRRSMLTVVYVLVVMKKYSMIKPSQSGTRVEMPDSMSPSENYYSLASDFATSSVLMLVTRLLPDSTSNDLCTANRFFQEGRY